METQISAYNPTLKQKIEDTFGISLLKLLQGAKASVPFIEQPAVGSVENEYQNSPQGKFAKTVVDTGSMAAGAGKNILNSLRDIKRFETAADLFRLNRAIPKGVVVAQKTIDEAKHLRDLNATMGSIKPVVIGMTETPIMPALAKAGSKFVDQAAITPGIVAIPDLVNKIANEAGNAVGITRGDFNAKSSEQNSLELAGEKPAPAASTPEKVTPTGESYHKIQDQRMPVGDTSFADNLPAVPTAPTQEQGQDQDPLITAIFNLLAQKPEQTVAVQPRDTAAVVDEFNRRNPKANPENKPGFDKFLDFIGLSRGPAQLNPAELLKLQADLGISSEGLAGEQQLNRGMRSAEHGAVVGGQPQARDYLNILAGKSNIQDQTNAQSRLQAEQAGLTKDINRANVGNQKEIIGATSAAQTSPRAVRSEIAVRNPEGMTKETFEETIGVPIGSLSNEQWEIIRASNNKAASPMEQVMAMLIAERIGRTGPGRQGQGQVPINTSALTQ